MSDEEWFQPAQVQVGSHTLEVFVDPIGSRFLVELRMPPKKGARATQPMVLATTHAATRGEIPGWIESVAGSVRAKLDAGERAVMLRKGYRPDAQPRIRPDWCGCDWAVRGGDHSILCHDPNSK